MPLDAEARARVAVQRAIGFRGLAVVAVYLASFAAGDEVLAVVTEVYGAGVASTIVAIELFGPESSKVSTLILIDDDLIVR